MTVNLPLKDKYRPVSFDTLFGNDNLKKSLQTVLERTTGIPHAFLLTGPSGCGKTTMAGIIRRVLGCSDMDYAVYDTANTRGIDTIRDIGTSTIYTPMAGKCKVYLIDEAHKITGDGQNAILKLLEEPPPYVYFILCTTDPDKLLKTIKTRCTAYQVSPLNNRECIALMHYVCEQEGVEGFPDWAMEKIAVVSEGCARKTLVILDQVLDIMEDDLLARAIDEQTVDNAQVIELCRQIMNGDWVTCQTILRNLKEEPENVRYGILGYFNSILLNPQSTGNHDFASMVIKRFKESFMYIGKAGLTDACFDCTKPQGTPRRK